MRCRNVRSNDDVQAASPCANRRRYWWAGCVLARRVAEIATNSDPSPAGFARQPRTRCSGRWTRPKGRLRWTTSTS